jgi:FKBP-type peptidyl-prolyl cis-trans isomerase
MFRVSRMLAVIAWVAMAGCQQSSTTSNVSGSPAPEAASSPAAAVATPAPGATATTASGVKVEDLVVGTGATAEKGKTVSVHYTGWLIDKSKADHFDSSYDHGQPYQFVLGTGAVIKGWDEGLVGMKVGGKRMLTIPPDLAYGPTGSGPIPPNATLVFETELMDVR